MRCANLICVVRKGSIVSKDSSVTPFTNSACSFSTSTHFDCTAATLGNACGLNRASRRFLKPAKRVELWGGSFQIRKPDPLASDNVDERIPHGTKATTQIVRELLRAERRGGLQNPVVRPAVVFVEQLNIIFCHVTLDRRPVRLGILPCPEYSAKTGCRHF